MSDETDADLFIEAQDTVWESVIEDLKAGKKTGHWMWFVFPQLASLGQSDIASLFGLHDLAEARAYLENATLRTRLEQASALVLKHKSLTARNIFGPVDAMKLRSSMTLFAAVPGASPVFAEVLDVFYEGEPCPKTRAEIG